MSSQRAAAEHYLLTAITSVNLRQCAHLYKMRLTTPGNGYNVNGEGEQQKIITLSDLINQDLPSTLGSAGCYVMLEYPTTFAEGDWRNESKYPLYDYGCQPLYVRKYLMPWRYLPFIGSSVPVLLECPPPDCLVAHWKTWIPGFIEPVTLSYREGLLEDDVPVSFSVPFEQVPAHKHLICPDTWYSLHNKASLPACGVRAPRRLSSLVPPCMVKACHASGSRGVWRAETASDGASAIAELRDHGWQGGIIFEEIVRSVVADVCAQFYVHANGSHTWMGVTHQVFDEVTQLFAGGRVCFSEQDRLRLKYESFLLPVVSWLHASGYRGYCGVDVLEDGEGKLFAVDVNPRLCGSTPALLLAPVMAAHYGYEHGCIASATFAASTRHLLAVADKLSCLSRGGICIVMSSWDLSSTSCKAYICSFAETRDGPQKLLRELEATCLEPADEDARVYDIAKCRDEGNCLTSL